MEASDEWVVIEPSDSDLTLDNLPDEVRWWGGKKFRLHISH